MKYEQLSSNNEADFENLMPEGEVVLMKSELTESLLTEAEKPCATTKNEYRTGIRAKKDEASDGCMSTVIKKRGCAKKRKIDGKELKGFLSFQKFQILNNI